MIGQKQYFCKSDIVTYQVCITTVITGFVTRVTRRMPHVEQELPTTPEHLSSHWVQIYVSVRGTNGAGLSSVGTSNALYMSYLSQGLSPLSHIGVYDVLENSHGDV
jgi:hypothetical protein